MHCARNWKALSKFRVGVGIKFDDRCFIAVQSFKRFVRV